VKRASGKNVESGVRYRDLFGDREFTALFTADVASRVGSQLGKFALAALVYYKTQSLAATAATFAVTYLPGIIGGPILSTLADRLPRKPLLVTCDLIRASLMVWIAVVNMPIWLALAILLLVELVKVPFSSARMAILADIFEGPRFVAGNALVGASQQAVQVIGFGFGAVLVAQLGPQFALVLDTCTYVLSALLIGTLVRRRPAPKSTEPGKFPNLLKDTAVGIRVVHETGRMPTLFWLLFLGPTVLATAEGLAIPYADLLDANQLAGIFLAATPAGTVIGLSVVGRMSQRTREKVLIPFSMAVGICVAITALVPIPFVITLSLFLAGLAMGHLAHLQGSIVGLVSSDVRGRIIGLANTVLQIGQGLAILLAGIVADATSIQYVLLYSGVGATIGVLFVSAVGAPFAGKHRDDPRARRRARRKARRAAGAQPTAQPARPARPAQPGWSLRPEPPSYHPPAPGPAPAPAYRQPAANGNGYPLRPAMAYRAEDPYSHEPERPVRPLYRPQPQTSYQPGVRNPYRRPYAVRDYSDYPVEPPSEQPVNGHSNGHSNGHTNGHSNGHARRPLETDYYRRIPG
jgi:MFS family permease